MRLSQLHCLKTCMFFLFVFFKRVLERRAASPISCFHDPYPEMSTKETQLQRPQSICSCSLNTLRLFWTSGPIHSEDSRGKPLAGECPDQGSAPLEIKNIPHLGTKFSETNDHVTVMYHQNKSGHTSSQTDFQNTSEHIKRMRSLHTRLRKTQHFCFLRAAYTFAHQDTNLKTSKN